MIIIVLWNLHHTVWLPPGLILIWSEPSVNVAFSAYSFCEPFGEYQPPKWDSEFMRERLFLWNQHLFRLFANETHNRLLLAALPFNWFQIYCLITYFGVYSSSKWIIAWDYRIYIGFEIWNLKSDFWLDQVVTNGLLRKSSVRWERFVFLIYKKCQWNTFILQY